METGEEEIKKSMNMKKEVESESTGTRFIAYDHLFVNFRKIEISLLSHNSNILLMTTSFSR
jgi:hypothetical protein